VSPSLGLWQSRDKHFAGNGRPGGLNQAQLQPKSICFGGLKALSDPLETDTPKLVHETWSFLLPAGQGRGHGENQAEATHRAQGRRAGISRIAGRANVILATTCRAKKDSRVLAVGSGDGKSRSLIRAGPTSRPETEGEQHSNRGPMVGRRTAEFGAYADYSKGSRAHRSPALLAIKRSCDGNPLPLPWAALLSTKESAMGGDNIPSFWSKAACIVLFNLFFLFAIFVLAVWVWIVLGLIGLVNNSLVSVTQGCLIFSLTIAMGCAILWFGKQTEIVALKDRAEKGIWLVLIAAVIGVIVSGAKLSVNHDQAEHSSPTAAAQR